MPEEIRSALRGELGRVEHDRGVSTEISITVRDPRINDGMPTNIPTLVKGQTDLPLLLKTMKPNQKQYDIAVMRAMERQASGEELPFYETEEEAVQAAIARSKNKDDEDYYNQTAPYKLK